MSARSRAAALVAAVVLTAVPMSAATGASLGGDVIERLPYAVDTSNNAGWWTPLDVHDGVTYVAFNAPAAVDARHEVHVAARDAAGVWTAGCLQDAAGACVTFLDDNGHNQPSIAVAGDGSIHVFASMHHVPWIYYRSTVTGDVTSLRDVSAELPDQGVPMTYPVTARTGGGDLYLVARGGRDEATVRDGRLYRYDLATGTWSRITVFASATGASVYTDDLEVGDDGRVHVLFEWHRWPAGPYRHAGSYAVYDPADGSWRDAAGTALTLPLRPDSSPAIAYQPFAAGESLATDAPTVQTAKLSLDDDGAPTVAYRCAPARADGTPDRFDVRTARWDGTSWQRETVIGASDLGPGIDTVAALDTTQAGGVTRVYAVAQGTVDGVARNRVIRAERTHPTSAWRFAGLGDAAPGQQRLAARTRDDGTDVVYLSATTATTGSLSMATLPRTDEGIAGIPLGDVVSDLRPDDPEPDPPTGNLALGGQVTVSSALRADTGGELAVDGLVTDASRWISAVDDATPSITVAWSRAEPVATVTVHSGYHAAIDPAEAVLRDFTIELRTSAGWVEVGRFADNRSGTVTVTAASDVVADQVRLLITDPSASTTTDVARVFEIEVQAAGT